MTFFIVVEETSTLMKKVVTIFKKHIRNWFPVRVLITDKDFKEVGLSQGYMSTSCMQTFTLTKNEKKWG